MMIYREIRNMFIRTIYLLVVLPNVLLKLKFYYIQHTVFVFMMQVCGLDIKLGLLTKCYHVTISA